MSAQFLAGVIIAAPLSIYIGWQIAEALKRRFPRLKG